MAAYCVACGEEIFEAMGSVLARDFLDYINGKRRHDQIRQICGRDNLKMQIYILHGGNKGDTK